MYNSYNYYKHIKIVFNLFLYKYFSTEKLKTHFSAGNTDLWSGVDVDPAVGQPGYGRPDRVGDAHRQRTPVLAILQRHQRVRRLTRLAEIFRLVVLIGL